MKNIFSKSDMSENEGQDYLRISMFEVNILSMFFVFIFRIVSSRLYLITSVSVFIEIGKLS